MRNLEDFEKGIPPKIIEKLRLPSELDEDVYKTALDIDDLLARDKRSKDQLDAKLAAHHEKAITHLMTFHGKQIFDLDLFHWPSSLFIPKGANPHDYWFSPAPADQRYGLAWTAPASATANTASIEDGTLFSFSQLLNEKAGSPQSSEAGVGIFYKPIMSLGVIELRPHVDCSGSLRTFLEFFPQLAAGYVEVKAQLLLAAWQQIPGGFDLLNFKQFEVATSGRRDQTHRAENLTFQNSFAGSNLSAPFVVQSGRTYLLGVVGRISITSTLTTTDGKPLPAISNQELRVWGSMNCVLPQIDVLTQRVDIP